MNKDELNYIIYRYLQECGYDHSAFVFGVESRLSHSSIEPSSIPSMALISLVQRGLQFHELEMANMVVPPPPPPPLPPPPHLARPNEKSDVTNSCNGNAQSIMTMTSTNQMNLRGHESEVFICSWHPFEDLLATGSGDSTARIWNLIEPREPTQLVLRHSFRKTDVFTIPCNMDVTTLEWDPSGTLLGTGSFDGFARIWTSDGQLKGILGQHEGPIFSLKWNNKGNYILSAGDRSVVVWNAETGKCEQQYRKADMEFIKRERHLHESRVLDVDWQTDTIFATCSADEKIYVCRVGAEKPLRSFLGHKGEINAIKWDPQGQLLASCSDDMTVKVWSPKNEDCLFSFDGHTKEIYTICWSPTGPNTNNPFGRLLLASASFESNVRIWEVQKGTCLLVLSGHTEPVYSVSFSPSGQLLASGSFDRQIFIWDIQAGRLAQKYKCSGSVFNVSWNSRGDRIGASLSDGAVSIVDLRH
ncbi:hypothetical protein ACOME3_009409 [Neoechinorhynchus agilis]